MSTTPPGLFIHAIEENSSANGPGNRFVIWVQGCTLNCPDCFNPETHDINQGEYKSIDILIEQILLYKEQIDGITISGGEPIQQIESLITLLKAVKSKTNLPVLIFTGYTTRKIQQLKEYNELHQYCDALITGPYEQNKKLKTGLLGSSNQEILLFSNRIPLNTLENSENSEILIKADGEIIISGIDPVNWG